MSFIHDALEIYGTNRKETFRGSGTARRKREQSTFFAYLHAPVPGHRHPLHLFSSDLVKNAKRSRRQFYSGQLWCLPLGSFVRSFARELGWLAGGLAGSLARCLAGRLPVCTTGDLAAGATTATAKEKSQARTSDEQFIREMKPFFRSVLRSHQNGKSFEPKSAIELEMCLAPESREDDPFLLTSLRSIIMKITLTRQRIIAFGRRSCSSKFKIEQI